MPDLHSGIEGGAIEEPMVDMWVLLFVPSDCKVLRLLRKGSNFWLPLLIARGIFKYLSFVSLYLLHSAIFDRLECQMTESDPKPRKRKSSISCFQRLHKNLLHFCVLNGENRL